MSLLDLNSTLVRAEDIVSCPVENALLMMDMGGGGYFSLDDIGTAIWEHLAEPLSVQSLCEQLTAAYAVEPEVCRVDVLAFLNELVDAGLVVRR